MLTTRSWWCIGRIVRSLYEELASSFSERVFGRRIRTKGEREARMAELSEFDMALSRMMDRRVIQRRSKQLTRSTVSAVLKEAPCVSGSDCIERLSHSLH